MVEYDWGYISSIWSEFQAKELSMKKRDELLAGPREKLRVGLINMTLEERLAVTAKLKLRIQHMKEKAK